MATVRSSRSFNSSEAAAALYTAMKGLGTDEKTIIRVIAECSNEQRQLIKLQFQQDYSKDLTSMLRSDLSGNFEKTVLSCLMLPSTLAAHQLRIAMKGIGCDIHDMTEILCTHNNNELVEIRQVYEEEFGRELEKDLVSETKGELRTLITTLCAGGRDVMDDVHVGQAKKDARELQKACANKDLPAITRILCYRSFSQLRQTFVEYSEAGQDIEDGIKMAAKGQLKDAYSIIIQRTKDLFVFFAQRLYKSMKGLGTNDNDLIRIVVSRSETDLLFIKRAFMHCHQKTLESFIKGDCSGDYLGMLLALVGDED